MDALVIGGTGPSGPHVVGGLLAAGHEVTVLHRGVHEGPLDGLAVTHIHADPHFRESLEDGLCGRTFDVVVAMYGRLAVVADVLAGRCGRLVAVGGIPIYRGYLDPESVHHNGLRTPVREDSPLVDPAMVADPTVAGFAARLREAERAVLDHHAAGSYEATIVRLPIVYGPRNLVPREWSILQRIRDGRAILPVPDGGRVLIARCAARNAAHALLLAAASPTAAGEVFHCADDEQLDLAQWATLTAGLAGGRLEIAGVPRDQEWLVSYLLPLSGTTARTVVLDQTKARTVLGYRGVVSVDDAVAETVRWLRVNPVRPSRYPAYGDRFDYAAEDRVRALLDDLTSAARDLGSSAGVVHAYPHPTAPALAADHRGR